MTHLCLSTCALINGKEGQNSVVIILSFDYSIIERLFITSGSISICSSHSQFVAFKLITDTF